MGGAFSWVEDNWFLVLQSAGIVAGLLFTAVSIRQETKARRISDLLTLAEHHRALWNELLRQPDLERILDADADPAASPLTRLERRFLNLAIVHFHTGWQLARQGSLITPSVLAADVRAFFKLPVPQAVWRESRAARDPEFVGFVEESLGDDGAEKGEDCL